jgi:HEAT repeat protein
MTRRRWQPWVLGLGVAASVAALYGWQRQPSGSERRADPGPSDSVQSAAKLSATQAAMPAGEEAAYDLVLDNRVSSEQQTILQFKLVGVWRLTSLGTLGAGASFRVALQEPRVTSTLDNAESAAHLADFAKGLDAPFFVSKDPLGAVIQARLASNVPLPAQTLLKSIAAYSQIVTSDKGQSSWQSVEVDTTGRYQASYRKLSESAIEKQKLAYSEILGAATGALVQGQSNRVESSKATIQLDSAGRLQSLELHEVLLGSGGAMPDLTSVTQLSLKRKQLDQARIDLSNAARDFAAFVPGQLFERKRSGVREPELDRARVGGQTFPQLMGKLRSLGAASESNRTERARAFVALSALFRQDPAAAELALRAIRRGTEADYLVEALGNASSPEAQAALHQLIEDRSTSPELRSRAVATLGNSSPATEDTVTLLASLSKQPDVGPTAKLALGATVYNLQGSNPALAERGTKELLGMLERDAGRGSVHNDLRALGNAGSTLALPAVSQALASSDPQVRLSAVYGLRRMPGAEVDALLSDASLSDESSVVRRAALSSMRGRPASETLMSALVQSVKLETNYDARLQAINALADWARTQPPAAAALAWAAQNDEDERLRAIAQLAMGPT